MSLAEAGFVVAIEQRRGATWIRVASARTRESGAFAARSEPEQGGAVRARLVESGSASPDTGLGVRPIVKVSDARGTCVSRCAAANSCAAGGVRGAVTVRVRQGGRRIASVRERLAGGSRGRVPTPGVGRFRVSLVRSGPTTPRARPGHGLGDRCCGRRPQQSTGRRVGGRARASRRLLARLLQDQRPRRRCAVPGGRGLQRCRGRGRLGGARPGAPRRSWRYRKPDLHRGRQDAPDPSWSFATARWNPSSPSRPARPETRPKAPSGSAGRRSRRRRGSGPRSSTAMTFLGNEHAIHGFPSVPAYAASHGCVRAPMWLADWLYRRSPSASACTSTSRGRGSGAFVALVALVALGCGGGGDDSPQEEYQQELSQAASDLDGGVGEARRRSLAGDDRRGLVRRGGR